MLVNDYQCSHERRNRRHEQPRKNTNVEFMNFIRLMLSANMVLYHLLSNHRSNSYIAAVKDVVAALGDEALLRRNP